MVVELLCRELGTEPAQPEPIQHRARFPLIETSHPGAPCEELTPERIAEILIEDEVDAYFEAMGQPRPDKTDTN